MVIISHLFLQTTGPGRERALHFSVGWKQRRPRGVPLQNTVATASEEEKVRSDGEMAWWNKKVVFPVKRALVAVAARVKARKNDDGISKLHDDVLMCGYQDVQVMWEMLRKSEMELSHEPKQRKRYL